MSELEKYINRKKSKTAKPSMTMSNIFSNQDRNYSTSFCTEQNDTHYESSPQNFKNFKRFFYSL